MFQCQDNIVFYLLLDQMHLLFLYLTRRVYLSHACDVFLALLGPPGVFSRPDSLVRTIILSKWQFWGQGLNFNAPGHGAGPPQGGGPGRRRLALRLGAPATPAARQVHVQASQ